MPSKNLTKSAYQNLFKDICAVHDAGMKKAAATLETIMILVRVEVGNLLIQAGLDDDQEVNQLEKISKDLTATNRRGFSVSNLKNMRQVYQSFTKRQISGGLTWSQLVLLSTVCEKKARDQIFKKALSHKFSFEDLKKEIDEKGLINAPSRLLLEAPGKEQESASKIMPRLQYKRGIIRTYRIKETLNSLEPSELQIDCGFFNYRDLDPKVIEELKLKAGDCVTAATKAEGWSLTKLTTDVKRVTFLYTFQATLHRLPDADTPTVVALLGFGFVSKQKLRMRGINAPEINTEAGKKAREFVYEKLNSVKFFVVKTYSTDIYDRYLVDIFYLPGVDDPQKVADEGIYLNQELIDEGHADIWRKIEPEDLLKLN